MQYKEYLRGCRERFGMTQEELVTELYLFDSQKFGGLDITTLSKWERGRSQPPPARISDILRYFQKRSGEKLPCWGEEEPYSIDSLLCREAMRSLIGKTRILYNHLPVDTLPKEHLTLIPLRQFERREQLLEVHQLLYDDIYDGFASVELERFKEWSLDPRHFFQVLLYKETFLGLLFALRLKETAFDELLDFRRGRASIAFDDIADFDEEGSLFILSSYAFHPKVLSILFMKLTAHLITHQESYHRLGLTTGLPEVERMVERIDMRHRNAFHGDVGEEIHSYSISLEELFRNEEILRTLFPRNECPG